MIIGIDCSHWQDNNSTPLMMDFNKARAAGARFAIMKASQATWGDEDYRYNNANAKAAGLVRGAYHFMTWTEPEAQAEFFWRTIKADPGELPPVADFEWWNPTPPNALDVLARFLARLESLCGRTPMIYTSAGFWNPYGSRDAKWARYPLWVAHYTTAAAPMIPLPWNKYAIWQYTSKGDGALYGAESAGIDLNRMSEETLKALTGAVIEPEQPEEPNMYKNNPLLYYALTPTDGGTGGGWQNPLFAGFVCHACKGVGTPNAHLKEMEEKAAALRKPYIIEYGFDVSFYTGGQLAMDESRWPPLELDEPLRMLTRAVMNRNPVEVWVTLNNPKDHTGGNADPQWIDYAARMFLKKLSEWKKANGKTWRIRVVTSWDFMNTYAPGKLNWLGDYATAINQGAKAPLDASYPQATDKPGWLGAVEGWRFWWYSARLIMFNGALPALETELHTDIPDPEQPEEPEEPEEPTGDYGAVLGALAEIDEKVQAILDRLNEVFK